MSRRNRCLLLGLVIILALQVTACARTSVEEVSKEEPARIEPILGTAFNRVILTQRAAERLDVQTDVVREMDVNGAQALVVPYAAVLYGLNGETWLYVSPEPLTYYRQLITIDHIEGDLAILSDGPASGTVVVTVGVAQLYGADTGVGK